MVNFGFNLITLIGFIDVLGAIGYLILALAQISNGVNSTNPTFNTVLRLLELFIFPIALFLSGVILIFNGWRLDPVLQFQQLLFHVIVGMAFVRTLAQIADSSR